MPTETITINSPPKAQPRPRVTKWGTFDAAKDIKNWARIQISEQVTEKLDCPLKMDVKYFLPIPKTTSKKKKALMLSNEIKHVKRPDIDNFVKLTLDVLNNIAFYDDSQIWSLSATKLYSEQPHTTITITWDDPHHLTEFLRFFIAIVLECTTPRTKPTIQPITHTKNIIT